MDKFKKIILNKKNDKSSIIQYTTCFVNNNKVSELLMKNDEFRKLKDNVNKK